MEIKLDYECTRGLIINRGWDEFLEFLCKKYDELKLYSISQDWFWDRKFICKCKGELGDLIIRWE